MSSGRAVSCEGGIFSFSFDFIKPMLLEQRKLAGGEPPELIWQQAQLYVGYVVDGSPEGFLRIAAFFSRSFSRAASHIGIEEGSDVSRKDL